MNIITVENISKKYVIRHQTNNFNTFRDVIGEKIKRLVGRGNDEGEREEFWALKDVSFDVKEGERVGIIGRNGAGKSTMLKLLSRITEPTEGRISIRGRVASLLEVGTGFHPELSGRENIFLNGAILGMKREEIKKKFDEIVDFAEVEKFLDTPVKRYSSGMYVRLAFAVAAHLEPEILMVDEVLAVGDAEFQKKCIGKMNDVSKAGRTILFVSHNMGAIEQLCSRTVVLRQGEKIFDGETQEGINIYLRKNEKVFSNEAEADLSNYPDRDSMGNTARINKIKLMSIAGQVTNEFKMGEDIAVEIETRFNETVKDPIFDLTVTNSIGQYISNIRSDWEGFHNHDSNGIVKTRIIFKNPPLTPGVYFLSPEVIRSITEGACLDIVHIPISFKILNNDITGFGSYTNWDSNKNINMHIKSDWS
ncbi:MAG: ABC transporter ATP-binding protein [Ignavibacteriae bacterium]|nr:ABC transporter ATP-binding protein [Ignavibacteriota bacterium]